MNYLVKRIDAFLIIVLIITSFWSTESHVLRLVDKLNSTKFNEEAILHFNRLAKTHRLHNPCAPGRQPSKVSPEHRKTYYSLEDDNTYSNTDSVLTALTGTPGNKPGLTLLRELITKSIFLQGLATNVIRMVSVCTTIHTGFQTIPN